MTEFLQELDCLERNLDAMLAEDDLYWLRNDAKFRAVEQTANYQDFENFVKAAHLKPLDRKDKAGLPGSSEGKGGIWNPLSEDNSLERAQIYSSKDKQGQDESRNGSTDVDSGNGPLKNISGLLSSWKVCGGDYYRQAELLVSHVDDLPPIFKGKEAPNTIVAAIPECMSLFRNKTGSMSSGGIIQVLESFSQCIRFRLTLMMCLEDKQRDVMTALLSQIETDGVGEYKIAAAKEIWGCH